MTSRELLCIIFELMICKNYVFKSIAAVLSDAKLSQHSFNGQRNSFYVHNKQTSFTCHKVPNILMSIVFLQSHFISVVSSLIKRQLFQDTFSLYTTPLMDLEHEELYLIIICNIGLGRGA